MKEWLFLNWIALGSSGVSPGYEERAAAVVTDLADPGLAFGNGTTMSTRKAAQTIVFELFAEMRVGFANLLVKDRAQGRRHLESILRPGRMRH